MTPAVTVLDRAGVPYQLLSYDHDPAAEAYGTEAAEALGLDPQSVFKTLVAVADGMSHIMGVVPVNGRLDLKALARAAGAKRAAMADHHDAERLTGYVVGGISPLGQRKQLATFVDESAESQVVIRISGGRRGLEIELNPGDLVAAINGRFAPIATS
ncbi:MAG: Cys-tRNA(Pro) deacylase [Actinomycetia bacterium]|nr:Cys-tRNA(Pro) deacylase [Actinomycetes bacterium]